MPIVFVSYRRDDDPHAAGRICDRLTAEFGKKSVFFDIDSIPVGIDFRKYLTLAVTKCDALVVVIGDAWLDVRDEHGQRRLDEPDDNVRIEVEVALQRGIPVVPVLVGRQHIPRESDLPPSLAQLSYRNAVEVKAGTTFDSQMDRLISGIASVCERIRREKQKKKTAESPVKSEAIPPPQDGSSAAAKATVHVAERSDMKQGAARTAGNRIPTKWRAVAMTAAVFAIVLLLTVVIFVPTKYGTIRIEIDDPDIKVKIADQQITIENQGEPIRLKAGDHKLIVERDGLETQTKQLTLKSDGKIVVRVMLLDGKVVALIEDPDAPDRALEDTHPSGDTLNESPITLVRKFEDFPRVVRGLAISPDGKYIVAGGGSARDGTENPVLCWDAQTGDVVRRFGGDMDHVTGVAISPDMQYLLTAGYDAQARIWNFQTGELVHRIKPMGIRWPCNVAITPDSRFAVVSNSLGWTVTNLTTGEHVRSGAFEKQPAPRLSPDGSWVIVRETVEDRRLVKLVNLTTGTQREIKDRQWHRFSRDGNHVLSVIPDTSILVLWNAATGEEIRRTQIGLSGFYIAALSPDERWCLIQGGRYNFEAKDQNRITLWDLKTGEELAAFREYPNLINFSADGRFFVSAVKSTVCLWKLTGPDSGANQTITDKEASTPVEKKKDEEQ